MIEPVAYLKTWTVPGMCHTAKRVDLHPELDAWMNIAKVTPLYDHAIPPGYALVKVEQVKDAERYAWLRNKSFGQFTHPIAVEQRPEGSVPKYIGPLFGDLLDSQIDAAISAAKGE